ncbi:class I SAM-dependent rRNA methyltransferase [Candidatus Igneacidithiobacillus taiwanensis]|uniref:class I SAM-dependent rRNA methyltransferase n=1 Tax=Candidatus Igneacidithiobacillus taiwanensis TaxID=1945924 RepID=UPI00289DE0C7|nr:class I SAM-dependent rRNA methyltransferase [Candidatus Igneacidithiobacillus taiwanensis]MCE5361052.1 class I SAM-dependent rRNA methyltransferase [Acidithiobacillus sp.]
MSSLPVLRLRAHEDRRLRAGHLWIYSNEVDTARTPLTAIEPGAVARLEDSHGKGLGLAHVSPHSLLCARLLTRDVREEIDVHFYRKRIAAAQALRARLLSTPFYRLVHGEGDGLPGLLIDRHGEYLVLQIGSHGMERDLPLIVSALEAEIPQRGILLKASGPARALEQLPERVEVLSGEVPAEIAIEENGCRFWIDPYGGQKTGWFYDHRRNRAMLRSFASGRRVLDLFSYSGAFALPLAQAGAAEVIAIDASASALALLQRNAEDNGLGSQVQARQGDALDQLRLLRDQGESFDLIVLDPPALIKSRKDSKEGTQAYRRLNDMALRLLRPGGLLFTASCSFHMPRDQLLHEIRQASRRSPCVILAEAGQDLDHPVPPAVPESRYLKAFLLQRPEYTEDSPDVADGDANGFA